MESYPKALKPGSAKKLQLISEGLAAIDILLAQMELEEERGKCGELKESINLVIYRSCGTVACFFNAVIFIL